MELRIDRLGHRGDGVAETPEGLVYAPFSLPGERLRGAVEGGRMAAPELLEPSPDRVAPPCPHFGACGGCLLQHASDTFLAGWKREQVAAALAARGLKTEIRETSVSPPASRRRVTLAGRRLKRGALIGYHGRAESQLVPIETCPIADPRIVAGFEPLRALVARGASRKGEARLLVTASEDGLDVAAEGLRPLDAATRADLAALAAEADWARLAVEGEVVALRRPPRQRFDRALVAPPPGGFLQATREGEAALLAGVREAMGEAARVADLFAGTGTFALPLAEQAAVRAVEAEGAALAALLAGWRGAEGLKPVETERRDLFRRPLSPEELARFDGVVMDPPRAGAAAQTSALAASPVPRVAMVSCNPASFARDARTLVDGGFRLLWARPVDQFRWSPHLELVAAFARE